MNDPCSTTAINGFQLSRSLKAAFDKSDDFTIPGPYSSVDISTNAYGLGKCGKIMCAAYLQDRSQPAYITVNNRVYNSIDNTYNTQLVLKPISGRDATGIFNVFIDCGLTDYPSVTHLNQGIKVEITATTTSRLLQQVSENVKDVELAVDTELEGREVRRSYHGGLARSYSAEDIQSSKEQMHGVNNMGQTREEHRAESRNLQSNQP